MSRTKRKVSFTTVGKHDFGYYVIHGYADANCGAKSRIAHRKAIEAQLDDAKEAGYSIQNANRASKIAPANWAYDDRDISAADETIWKKPNE